MRSSKTIQIMSENLLYCQTSYVLEQCSLEEATYIYFQRLSFNVRIFVSSLLQRSPVIVRSTVAYRRPFKHSRAVDEAKVHTRIFYP